MQTVEEAWKDYQADVATDPQLRYSNDRRSAFRAGWLANQSKHPAGRKSVWITAPNAIEDDPE